jgi:L-asparaginase type II
MARRINQVFREERDVDGVVLTHGTATLEETAYFLHLTVKSPKPVVVTGSMRPASAMGTDADLNLYNAIQTAACPHAAGRGVLTLLNNQIHSARDVVKTDTYRLETFKTPDLGLLGYADSDGQVVFYRALSQKHTTEAAFNVEGLQEMPRVDMVYTYTGADGLLVDAVRHHGSQGLVLVGLGSGNLPPPVEEAGAQAAKEGMAVVLASRISTGRVVTSPRKKQLGFIVADGLIPQKARILLMLALTITRDRQAIQQMFYEY